MKLGDWDDKSFVINLGEIVVALIVSKHCGIVDTDVDSRYTKI